MKKKQYEGPDRRKNIRVIYDAQKRPILKNGKYEFDIADISEMGLRFFNEEKIDLGNWVTGTATLLSGDSLDVEGMIVRKTGIDIFMNVNKPMQKETLLKEQHIVGKRDTEP